LIYGGVFRRLDITTFFYIVQSDQRKSRLEVLLPLRYWKANKKHLLRSPSRLCYNLGKTSKNNQNNVQKAVLRVTAFELVIFRLMSPEYFYAHEVVWNLFKLVAYITYPYIVFRIFLWSFKTIKNNDSDFRVALSLLSGIVLSALSILALGISYNPIRIAAGISIIVFVPKIWGRQYEAVCHSPKHENSQGASIKLVTTLRCIPLWLITVSLSLFLYLVINATIIRG
jgi:hypothetical protein